MGDLHEEYSFQLCQNIIFKLSWNETIIKSQKKDNRSVIHLGILIATRGHQLKFWAYMHSKRVWNEKERGLRTSQRISVSSKWQILSLVDSYSHSSVQLLSRVQLLATPWIAAHQASLSMSFHSVTYSKAVLLKLSATAFDHLEALLKCRLLGSQDLH